MGGAIIRRADRRSQQLKIAIFHPFEFTEKVPTAAEAAASCWNGLTLRRSQFQANVAQFLLQKSAKRSDCHP
jgi:hypothetical protein